MHLSPLPLIDLAASFPWFVNLVFNVSPIVYGGSVSVPCFMAFPHGAVGWSVVCDCGIS